MRDPTSYTDVIDAFDDGDPFDLNAHIGYSRVLERGTIQREYTDSTTHERSRTSIADSERVTSELMLGLDVGLYKDVMAFVRLPLILSDARSLSLPGGKSSADVNGVGGPLTDPFDYGGASGQLFSVPFKSPNRAGFDYIGIGGAWSILNQQRNAWHPTWVVMIEGRRAIGTPMRPCRKDGSQTICGNQAPGGEDIDGDGVPDGSNAAFRNDSAGSSKGLSGVAFETRLSRRYRYVEPYMGLGVLIQWASTAAKYFNPAGKLEGVLNTMPSQRATATLGSAIIPWENRGEHQRFSLDVRFSATYLSQGRDYSALYDALGTSNHAELTRPNFEGVRGVNPDTSGAISRCTDSSSADCYTGAKVPFYGLTDIQARLRTGLRIGIEMQAAEYIRFGLGTGLTWVTSYAMTASDPCNPAISDAGRSEAYRGNSCGAGIVNPSHRPAIDLPGRRFWMSGEMLVDLYATATAQF